MSRIVLAAPAALVALSLALPARGQGVGDAALREKQRRERAAGAPSSAAPKTITDEDLRARAEQPRADAGSAPPEAAHTPPEAAPVPPEVASAPPVVPQESSSGGVSSAALLRHLASAEAYFIRCERRLSEARQRWLSAGEANEPGATEKARLEFEAAGRELERARAYRDEAEAAARRAGVKPGAE